MKTNRFASIATPLALVAALASPAGAVQPTSTVTPTTIPADPVGNLTANPTVVQTGTKPTLTWAMMFPTKLSDVAAINPPGGIDITAKQYVSVSIIGTTSSVPSEARISVGGGSYQQLFYGTQNDVNPSKPLYIKQLDPGTTIDFGGRSVENNQWSPFYTSNSSNLQVVSLVNGDVPPTSTPILQKPGVASFLKPYVDSSTGKIKIGPLSVLVIMEFNETARTKPGFDYSELALLVNFSAKHPNNGHGNNLDGVDSSNPGQGKGGPTGLNNAGLDPSAGVDDEKR